MKSLSLLFIVTIVINNHSLFASSDLHHDFFNDLDSDDNSAMLVLIDICPKQKNLPFPFFYNHHIFMKQSWNEKSVDIQSMTSEKILTGWFNEKCFKKNIKKETFRNDYRVQRWICTRLIIPHIETLELQKAKKVIDLCSIHKIHLFTTPYIHNKESKKNLIQKALKKARTKIKNNMKSNIITFIEQFDPMQQQQQQEIIKEKHITQMVFLYQLAIRLYNIHSQTFTNDHSFEKYRTNSEHILEEFFPRSYSLITQIRQNSSLTAKHDEHLDGFHSITF